MDARFGRCTFFAFLDGESEQWSFKSNPGALVSSGAGIKAAQFVLDEGAEVLITGKVGPKAWKVLQSAPMEVFTLAEEVSLEEAISLYYQGQAEHLSSAKGTAQGAGVSSFPGGEEVASTSRGEGLFQEEREGLDSRAEKEAEPQAHDTDPLRPGAEALRVAVATDGRLVSPHFGRCEGYTLFEVEGSRVLSQEFVPNPGHQPGFLPRFLGDKGVHWVIAGGMGPRAQQLFAEQGIEYVVGVTGEVEEALKGFLQNELADGASLCEHDYHGPRGCQEH